MSSSRSGRHPQLVSVVIPTLRRPGLVLRAVRSVLDQNYRNIELIVVVDGPDLETTKVLERVSDSRLKIVVNPKSLGAGGARNVGADTAAGEWLAFLDDDDEWLPNKLERQLAFASGDTLVTCLCRVVTPTATSVWPRKVFDNSTFIDEYFFDRRSVFLGTTFIQTSTYFMHRNLFKKIRFKVPEQLFCTPHDDWDFIIRLGKDVGANIKTVPEVLAIHYFEEPRASLGKDSKWRNSLEWIESLGPLISPHAYSGFCLCVAGSRAANARDYRGFVELLRRAFQRGAPRPIQVGLFLGYWLIPQDTRRRLRCLFRHKTKRSHKANSPQIDGAHVYGQSGGSL